jgi:hypothetical protein
MVHGAAEEIAAGSIGEHDEGHLVRNTELTDAVKKYGCGPSGTLGVTARPQQLNPVRVDPEGAEAEKILERHPEDAATRRILGDEGRTQDDAGTGRGDPRPLPATGEDLALLPRGG